MAVSLGTIAAKDGNNILVSGGGIQALNLGGPGPWSIANCIIDGIGGTNIASVLQFHNTDNQILSGTVYGLNTGGVTQTINAVGNVDRQRGTGFDNIPAVGVVTGTQQLAGPLLSTTTTSGAITGSGTAQNVTLNAVSFTNRGVTASFQKGTVLLVDPGAAVQEYVYLNSVNTSTKVVNGIFVNSHGAGITVQAFAYNQARDATIPDGSTPAGIGTSATYLFNAPNNTVEFERSAAGELDGATGTGTNIAAEYEYNANPLANGNVLSGLQFDRARNVQAGGLGSGTISNNPLAANSTTLTLNGAPTTLQIGAQIILDRAGANPETNYVGTGYTPGSTSVPLQIATQFSHAQNSTVEWGQHAVLGPQLNGFLPSGLGMEEEIIFDPVSKKYFVEIAATQDANSGQNLVIENPGLYNGSTFDRQRAMTGAIGTAQVGLVPGTAGGLMISRTLIVSGTNATNIKASAGQLYFYEVFNNSTNIAYLKFYNTAGTPTAGAGTIVWTAMVPGNSSGTGVVRSFENGVPFSTGIAFTFTGGIADNDTTSVAASSYIVNLGYK